MKRLSKWIIGAIAGTALVVGSTYLSKNKDSPKRKPLGLERTISFDNPQRTLDEALRFCKPSHVSEIIYDPDFEESDSYLRQSLTGLSETSIERYLQGTRTQFQGHNLCVTGVISNVGNGLKRPIFARKNVAYSPGILSMADLENTVHHEDIHAEEERYGYDFGDRRINGEELTILFNKGAIRTEVIGPIGEIGAYASQIERAKIAKRKPSIIHILNASTQLYSVTEIVSRGLRNGTLTPLEAKYAEAKLSKYKSTIETLKN